MIEPGDTVSFAPDWSEVGSLPLTFANVFATQVGAGAGPSQVPDGIILMVGSITPPVLLGPEDQNAALLRELNGKLPTQLAGRYIMSRERAEELIGVLQTAIQQYDAATRGVVRHG